VGVLGGVRAEEPNAEVGPDLGEGHEGLVVRSTKAHSSDAQRIPPHRRSLMTSQPPAPCRKPPCCAVPVPQERGSEADISGSNIFHNSPTSRVTLV
jgi:hypothetical protein